MNPHWAGYAVRACRGCYAARLRLERSQEEPTQLEAGLTHRHKRGGAGCRNRPGAGCQQTTRHRKFRPERGSNRNSASHFPDGSRTVTSAAHCHNTGLRSCSGHPCSRPWWV